MEKVSQEKTFHTHITSKRGWFDTDLQEVWRYRDLIILFTKRTFQLTYKQTVLGPIWIFLNPLLTSAIYTFIFGGIAGIKTEGVPRILFFLCNNAVWTYFATCVNKNAQTFIQNANVFGKVYFPRLTVPISVVLSSAIQFLIQMLMVLGFLFFFLIRGEVHPNWALWPLIPLLLLHLGILGLAFGVIVSSLTTKYRDLSLLVTFGVQLWMYATPIVYPLSLLGPGPMRTLLLINPVTVPVELMRVIVLGQGSFDPAYLALSLGITAIAAFFGILLFHRTEKTFMDTI